MVLAPSSAYRSSHAIGRPLCLTAMPASKHQAPKHKTTTFCYMHAKISIVLKSFEVPPPLNTVGLSSKLKQTGSSEARRRTKSILKKPVSIRLPKRQALFTVLRSPHIDKKSREQFAMRIHKQLIVIQTETTKLREKLLRFQLPDLSGVQLKVIFQYKTRLHT